MTGDEEQQTALEQAVREAWPEADDESVDTIIRTAARQARPVLGSEPAGREQGFQCPCANPYHHLSNGELQEMGYEPLTRTLYGEPDPQQTMEIAVGIAQAAHRRHQENLQAQRDGTANVLGIKPPIAWRARYDGDF